MKVRAPLVRNLLVLAFTGAGISLGACAVEFDGYVFDDDKFAEAKVGECLAFCTDQEEICGFEDERRYASKEDCLSLCSGYFENELECRIAHLDFAIEDPETHCPHTTEDGDNTCPDARSNSCDRFCLRVEVACPFDEEGNGVYQSGSACDDACADFSEGALECRFIELGRAESGNASSCPELLPTDSKCSED